MVHASGHFSPDFEVLALLVVAWLLVLVQEVSEKSIFAQSEKSKKMVKLMNLGVFGE